MLYHSAVSFSTPFVCFSITSVFICQHLLGIDGSSVVLGRSLHPNFSGFVAVPQDPGAIRITFIPLTENRITNLESSRYIFLLCKTQAQEIHVEEKPRRSSSKPRSVQCCVCSEADAGGVSVPWNTPLLSRRFFQRCPLPEETRSARDCCVGSWMESLSLGTSLAAPVPRAHLPPGAAAGAPVPARASDSCSSLLSCVHGHLFREAGGCLDKLKAKQWIQRYGISCFSKGYCPGTTTHSAGGCAPFP